MKAEKHLAVCMLVTNIDALTGGVQKNSRLLLGEFNRRGINTFVCARNYYNLPRIEIKDGTHFRRSPVWGTSMAINSILYLIDAFFWLVFNRKEYDVIHCQQMFGPTMVAAIVNIFIKKPILTRITSAGALGEPYALRKMPFAALRLRLVRRVSKWVALTEEMKRDIETLDISSDRIAIIYNATKIPEEVAFDSRSSKKLREKLNLGGEKIAVFVGRLSSEKGLDDLIKAWNIVRERHPYAQLLILGEGGNYRNVESDIRELAAKLELGEVVHFLGHIPNAIEYVLAADVFILPSRTEGMSNALVEAMAAGSAIVATRIEANEEICIDETNSLLVEPNKPLMLAAAVVRLFDSPELAEKLGRQARIFAENNLSVEAMASQYLNIYRKIVNDC